MATRRCTSAQVAYTGSMEGNKRGDIDSMPVPVGRLRGCRAAGRDGGLPPQRLEPCRDAAAGARGGVARLRWPALRLQQLVAHAVDVRRGGRRRLGLRRAGCPRLDGCRLQRLSRIAHDGFLDREMQAWAAERVFRCESKSISHHAKLLSVSRTIPGRACAGRALDSSGRSEGAAGSLPACLSRALLALVPTRYPGCAAEAGGVAAGAWAVALSFSAPTKLRAVAAFSPVGRAADALGLLMFTTGARGLLPFCLAASRLARHSASCCSIFELISAGLPRLCLPDALLQAIRSAFDIHSCLLACSDRAHSAGNDETTLSCRKAGSSISPQGAIALSPPPGASM